MKLKPLPGIPLGRVLCGLDVVRVLLQARVNPDAVVARHRLGRLPAENDGAARVSRFRLRDRDGEEVEIFVSTRPGYGGEPETLLFLPWESPVFPQNGGVSHLKTTVDAT